MKMNWLQRFMMGRYGTDGLNLGLMVVGMVCSLVSSIFDWWIVLIISYICFGAMFFRMFSRNIPARQKENIAAVKFFRPVSLKLKLWHQMWTYRKTHRYFKCPNCRQQIRVPKNKGKIRIICPKCRKDFIRKS